MVLEMSVEELARVMATEREAWQFIDVREPEEVSLAKIDGFEYLPLSRFAQWSPQIYQRFEREKPTVVMCHHGMRSSQMCQWLMNQGFTQVKNLSGGIDAYSYLMDGSIPRY